MSFTKFLGTFLQATFFGGTYEDIAFEVRVLKGEVTRAHERLDKEIARLNERLDALDAGGGSGPRGKKRLKIMSAAEAADVAAEPSKLDAAGALSPGPVVTATREAAAAAGLQELGRGEARFTPGMTVAAAWTAHPKAPEVFARHHLPGCIDCPLSEEETLEEGARLHSLDVTALLRDLSQLTSA